MLGARQVVMVRTIPFNNIGMEIVRAKAGINSWCPVGLRDSGPDVLETAGLVASDVARRETYRE